MNNSGPRITVSKETTYLTGPLRPDGTVDYLAAVNEHCSQGVTPENNAAVPLLQAIGPKEVPEQGREQFFKMLGISPLPEQGDYLVPFLEYAGRAGRSPARRIARPVAMA